MASLPAKSARQRRSPDVAVVPFHLIAEVTAAEFGTEFLAALVRSMHEATDISVAVITRGIGWPPVRARAAFSWRKAGSTLPDEYDLEGTPCAVVYQAQRLVMPSSSRVGHANY